MSSKETQKHVTVCKTETHTLEVNKFLITSKIEENNF